ncbi:hypothetical protein KIW84_012606 [Lathyrus oleraceus]|uniref:Uncharacterized protein n=1 Tax=Pisum sativum TaxID=3888 RepID=A0A9D5BIA9_PEA|nr:hypothetical protein KIW84_012606 [Pisum sativum]
MNIWKIFTRGKNWLDLSRLHRTSWNSGFNMLDGSDGFSGFPSPQRGSYSAFMQSEKHTTPSSDDIDKLGKVQSSFWREWKLKLEEQKRFAEHSRALQKIIPRVETERFLSRDSIYIENVVISRIDVVLVSDVWTNDEITTEVAGYKGEIIGNGVKTIETISTKVYPAINGCNKLRLAYVFGLLSECYLQLENTKDLSPIAQPNHTNGNIRFAHYYKDVYKYYILSSLSALEAKATTDFSSRTLECIQKNLSKLDQSYDSCRKHIRLLSQSNALTIMKQYLTVIVPLHSSYGFLPDNSTWQECLIVLLNFWMGLTDDMKEFSLEENSGETNSFNPQCLMSCLKVFMKLVMEDIISPSQGWSSIYSYVNCGLNGDYSVEIYNFSKAMVFLVVGLVPFQRYFLLLHWKLVHLLIVAQFSDNLQLPSSIRVYVLELMQFTSGKNIKGFSTEIQANVQPWEEWDELLYASRKSEAGVDKQSPDHKETSSRFTNTLVALKSSQLVTSISPSIEITPDDLLNVDTDVSFFLRLCGEATENLHFDALVSILEEWEGLFTMGKDREITTEASDGGND